MMVLAAADDATLTRMLAVASFVLDIVIIFFVKPLRDKARKIDTLEEKVAAATTKLVKQQFEQETLGLHAAMKTFKEELAENAVRLDRNDQTFTKQMEASFQQRLELMQTIHELGSWVRERTISKEDFRQALTDVRLDVDRSGQQVEEARTVVHEVKGLVDAMRNDARVARTRS